MVGRTRNQINSRMSGPRWFNNNPTVKIGEGPVPVNYTNCDDVTGPTDCDPFLVERFDSTGGVFNLAQSGPNQAQFVNYIVDGMRNSSNWGHVAVPGKPSDFVASTNAAARTNPSRPYVDVPANLLDMRHALESIQQAGLRTIDQVYNAGSRWLYYKFVITPLVSDVIKMTNASDQINRRIADIQRLHGDLGYRKTVQSFAGAVSGTSAPFLQSAGALLRASNRYTTQTVMKTHIRWAANNPGPAPGPRILNGMARRAVQGGTFDFSTLWEAVPWSWAIDWFSNIGEYLVAQRNIIPARIVGVYPMTHTRTVNEFTAIPVNGGFMTAGRCLRESKRRSVGSVSIDAHFNFLNGSQMGILASLAATRR